jgi:hypothetical protein
MQRNTLQVGATPGRIVLETRSEAHNATAVLRSAVRLSGHRRALVRLFDACERRVAT